MVISQSNSTPRGLNFDSEMLMGWRPAAQKLRHATCGTVVEDSTGMAGEILECSADKLIYYHMPKPGNGHITKFFYNASQLGQ
jgi:hypothetical protein